MERRKEDAEVAAVEAEECIVAALFGTAGVDAYNNLALKLRASDFYVVAYRMVFEAFGDLADKGFAPDAPMLVSHLRSKQGWSERTQELVTQAITVTYSPGNLLDYAGVVIEKAKARAIGGKLSEIQKAIPRVGGELSSEDVLRQLEAVSMSFADRETNDTLLRTPGEGLRAVVKRWEAIEAGEFRGVKIGIDALDERLGGLQGGQLIIIAGRPSMGKTALALNIPVHESILNVPELSPDALQNNPTPPPDASPLGAVFSLEMPNVQMTMRMLSNISGVEYGRITKGTFEQDDWSRLGLAFPRYEHSNIHLSEESYLTPALLRAKARMLMQRTKRKLRYLIVDYLQLMDADGAQAGANRTNDVSAISRGLKKLAMELDVPVIALSQLNRKLEERADKRPMMSDLRESGAIEADADVILFIYRDEVYNPDSPSKGTAEIIIGKGRDAGLGMVPSHCQLQYQRFGDMPRGAYSYESAYGG
ncbi:Replicative DNA helicase [Paraburkholderia domus]|uniref:replicative DNA helicase n=1 Tax=Paraburkholderia domus TaxID=2793075 RepID=UPI00191308F7|nr:replicative DNA helicase [Paraburkholderia domus]MBK5052914.1 replicative DNA helicase [Burkholderia sp. R-70006]CAE6822740.1 Replicative DNA helicase [Paraburkholderia domus]